MTRSRIGCLGGAGVACGLAVAAILIPLSGRYHTLFTPPGLPVDPEGVPQGAWVSGPAAAAPFGSKSGLILVSALALAILACVLVLLLRERRGPAALSAVVASVSWAVVLYGLTRVGVHWDLDGVVWYQTGERIWWACLLATRLLAALGIVLSASCVALSLLSRQGSPTVPPATR